MQENCQEINRLELNQYINRMRKMMIVWRVSVCEVSGDGRMDEKKPAIINMVVLCFCINVVCHTIYNDVLRAVAE